MGGYRQWSLNQNLKIEKSGTPKNQLTRLNLIIEKWEKAIKEKRDIIVMMDDNIDSNPNMDHNKFYKIKDLANTFFKHIDTNNITVHNNEFTRYVSHQKPSCIDHFFLQIVVIKF